MGINRKLFSRVTSQARHAKGKQSELATTICNKCGRTFSYIPKSTQVQRRRVCGRCKKFYKNGQDNYAFLPDHASSMKKSEAFVPMMIQRMTPAQIIRAFERGLV